MFGGTTFGKGPFGYIPYEATAIFSSDGAIGIVLNANFLTGSVIAGSTASMTQALASNWAGAGTFGSTADIAAALGLAADSFTVMVSAGAMDAPIALVADWQAQVVSMAEAEASLAIDSNVEWRSVVVHSAAVHAAIELMFNLDMGTIFSRFDNVGDAMERPQELRVMALVAAAIMERT